MRINPVIEFGARSGRTGLLLYPIAGFPEQSEKKFNKNLLNASESGIHMCRDHLGKIEKG
jgi:hypothetical protein